jgi:secreted trypsin-like serine protease
VAGTNVRAPGQPIYLWFGAQQQFGPVTTPGVVTGVGHIHPGYKPDYRNDIAVVILDEPYALDSYPVLPATGLLDAMKKNKSILGATFTVVGYGVTEMRVVEGTGPVNYWTGERQSGVLGFNSLTSLWINQVQNIAQGYQGACNGDSGGPSFLGSGAGETNIIVGVTSSGDIPCYSTNTVSRTDTPQARSWLQAWLDQYPN